MKSFQFGLLSAVVLGGQLSSESAYTADLAPKYVKAPAAIEAVSMWSGFYIGGNIGYGGGRSDTTFAPNFVAAVPTTLSFNEGGAFGGGQIGYNWRSGSFVYGLEADIQKSDVSGSTRRSPILDTFGALRGPDTFLSTSGKLDWFGTVRVRAGILAAPNVLLYVTGGYAYGKIDDRAETNFRNDGGAIYLSDFSSTRSGYTVGAGGEWAFASNWSAKLEYLYLNLGNRSSIAALPPFEVAYGFHSDYHLGRIGLNYHFGGPIVARY